MTPAQQAWLRAQIAAGNARHAQLVAQQQSLSDWPRSAWDKPPALLVYATEAMFAYYLAADGRVYQYDMDRFAPELDEITNAEMVREIYAKAREVFPALADLADR